MQSIAIGLLAGPLHHGDGSAQAGLTALRHQARADTVRRGRDVVLSLLLLCCTLPLLLIVALLIKLESPGPVLYRQERVGLRGRCFHLWKFRSMRTDAEASGPVWAACHDPRVTVVGAFIRAHRIDELPQLVNVLRGEMSLVGPRPERPVFVEQLVQVIPNFHQRTCVPPGLTGWAQVNGRNAMTWTERFARDVWYVEHWNLFLDMRILLQTMWQVLAQRGTSFEGHATMPEFSGSGEQRMLGTNK